MIVHVFEPLSLCNWQIAMIDGLLGTFRTVLHNAKDPAVKELARADINILLDARSEVMRARDQIIASREPQPA